MKVANQLNGLTKTFQLQSENQINAELKTCNGRLIKQLKGYVNIKLTRNENSTNQLIKNQYFENNNILRVDSRCVFVINMTDQKGSRLTKPYKNLFPM